MLFAIGWPGRGTSGCAPCVRTGPPIPRVSLALEDGRYPVVAEGETVLHPLPFPQEITDAFAAKYEWDVSVPHRPGGDRVLLEIPVRRWLLAGAAQ